MPPYTRGLHELGDGLFAFLQPDGGWGWSNAGLVVSDESSLLIDTLLVRGTAWVTARVASAIRLLQTGDTQSYAAVMALALLCAAGYAVIQVLK